MASQEFIVSDFQCWVQLSRNKLTDAIAAVFFSYLLFQHFTHLKQVLYTHQKMKKSKTWQDGILRIRTGGNKVNNSDLIPSYFTSSAAAGLSVAI